MELALPFVALGGLYVISNQNSEKCRRVSRACSPARPASDQPECRNR